MASITSLDNFELYQISLNLCIEIFQLCKRSNLSREWALTDQIKRATMSIPANLAEGWGRGSKKEFARFVSISYGSCNEVQTFLRIIQKLDLAPDEEIIKLLEKFTKLGKRLYLFRRSLI